MINNIFKLSDQKIDLRNNAFDFLRLIFALSVVFAHSNTYGFGLPSFALQIEDMQKEVTSGYISVIGFFIISGFLITNSWIHSKSIFDFSQKRFLRIFPGFWVCLFICAFIFAPWYFVLNGGGIGDYFQKFGLESYNYFWKNVLLEIKQQSVGDVLQKSFVNKLDDPFWSLIFEFRAYILIAIFGIMGIFKNKFLIIIPFLFFWYSHYNVVFNPEYRTWFQMWVGDYKIAPLFSYFFAGSVFLVWKDKIILDWKFFSLAIVSLYLVISINQFALIAPVSLTYAIIYLAAAIPIHNLSKKIGDLSYGIYIYSAPVQQLLVLIGVAKFGLWPYTFISMILSCGAGYLSWNFVEKRFLLRHNIALENPLNK